MYQVELRTLRLLILLSLLLVPLTSLKAESNPAVLAEWLRGTYYLIVGRPADYPAEKVSSVVPASGFLGLVNDFTGNSAVGGKLREAGHTECRNFPNNGQLEHTEGSHAYKILFKPAIKNIPPDWQDGGTAFEKRIEVERDGTKTMVGEFHCSSSTISGYQRLRNPFPIGNTELELFYQSVTATGATRLAFYVTYHDVGTAPSSGVSQRLAAHFEMLDGDSYQVHIDFSTEYPDPLNPELLTSFIGLRGKRSLNIAHVRLKNSNGLDTQSPMLTASEHCIDFTSNAALEASNCSSFQVSEPLPPLIGPIPASFSDNWVAKLMTLSPF